MVICIIHLPLGLSVLGDFQINLQKYIFFPNTQQFSDNFTRILRGGVKLLIINKIQKCYSGENRWSKEAIVYQKTVFMRHTDFSDYTDVARLWRAAAAGKICEIRVIRVTLNFKAEKNSHILNYSL